MKATKENKIIGIGSTVTIFDLDLREQQVYKIVSSKTGKQEELSFDSKLGEALLGKTIGDKVLVKAKEEYEIKILSVDNSNVQIKKSYRNTFFCFQGKQWENEISSGYIFALSDGFPHHERLRSLKKGDIIFHGSMQGIIAISIVEEEFVLEKRPDEHCLANDNKDAKGLMVKTKYQLINHPIATFRYKKEIINLQGNHEGKGYPFDKNGEGNQGYLFNLNTSLAKFFMEEIVKRNSFLEQKDYVKNLLQ